MRRGITRLFKSGAGLFIKNGVNRQDAEDITQEVALKYLEKQEMVDPEKIKA